MYLSKSVIPRRNLADEEACKPELVDRGQSTASNELWGRTDLELVSYWCLKTKDIPQEFSASGTSMSENSREID